MTGSAKQSMSPRKGRWIASSLALLAMTAVLLLVRPHQFRKPLEQVMRVARAGRRLGVVLHREHRLAVKLDAAIGAVEQRDMGLGRALRARRLIHRHPGV